MKIKLISLVVMALSLAASPAIYAENHAKNHDNQATSQEISQDATALISSLKDYSIEQRDKAVNKAQQVLANMDNKIDALENRIDKNWDNMSTQARDKTKATLKTLRQQRNKLSEQYGRIQSSSAAAWNDMKDGFANAYNALSNSWQEAEQAFSESQKKSNAK